MPIARVYFTCYLNADQLGTPGAAFGLVRPHKRGIAVKNTKQNQKPYAFCPLLRRRVCSTQNMWGKERGLTKRRNGWVIWLRACVRYKEPASGWVSLAFITRMRSNPRQKLGRISLSFFFLMVVANCSASCYWLHVHCSQWQLLLFLFNWIEGWFCHHGRLYAVSLETASRDTQTHNLSRNVSKFYARQAVSDNRAAKPKFDA